MKVETQRIDDIFIVTINRPQKRNAVDLETAKLLVEVFSGFEQDDSLNIAVLTGASNNFCAGADLNEIAQGRGNRIEFGGDAPMGPTRMRLSKPVIAAVEGHAVAGGLELALWADLRVASSDAIFGVFCRRFGVPLIDLGTIRLPRLIGQSRALDMILTGRSVDANEALQIGLINRVAAPGTALASAVILAREISKHPQTCMRMDRLSSYEQFDLSEKDAIANELQRGMKSLQSVEALNGAKSFNAGKGRHGNFS